MAAHYGAAVIPARVRKPRDKAKVEAGVLVDRALDTCGSPIFIGGKIEAKYNRERVSLRIGLRLCPHHRPVRLRLSTRQSAGASPQSPAPELLEVLVQIS
jgi:hypothetical protein